MNIIHPSNKMENVHQHDHPSSSPELDAAAISAPLPVSPGASYSAPAIKKKREDKLRRRDHRSLDNVMKSIQVGDDTEKLTALSSKYGELYEEFRASQNLLMGSEKRISTLVREKSQLEAEQSKSILARSRMENLCRELQRQNKLIKEENTTKIREEEERRKEVAAKFQLTLNEVTTMMQESSEKNLKLRDDNIDMANKISALCEQFEKREEQLCKVSKQIELEKQLAEAKIAKARIEYEADREKYNMEKDLWKKERDYLTAELERSNEKCAHLQINIKSLQEQIQMYTGKYEEFESTISKSSQVFDNCKIEMSKMNKQIMSLEKELKVWKKHSQMKALTIEELSAVRDSKENQITNLSKRLEQLTKLCRQIQTERALYLRLLRQNNIEPPKTGSLTKNGESTTKIKSQVDETGLRKKEIQLEELKSELLAIQKQVAIVQAQNNKDEVPDEEITDEVQQVLNHAQTDIKYNQIGNNTQDMNEESQEAQN